MDKHRNIQWEHSTSDRKQLIFYNRSFVLEPGVAGITQDYRVWLEARFYTPAVSGVHYATPLLHLHR